MDTLKELFANINRKHAAIILLIVLAFVGLSVSRCVSVHSAIEPEAGIETESQEAAPADEKASDGPEQEDTTFSDEQQSLIENYDEQTKEFVSLLTANTWTSQNESASLTFTDRTFTESYGQGNRQAERTFAISAYEKTERTESGVNGESVRTVTHSAAILTEDGTYLFTLRQITAENSVNSGWSVTSNAFEYSDSYILSQAAEALSISGLNSAFGALIDGHTEELSQALSDFCSEYYPTSTTAEWSQEATIDWSGSLLVTSFKLNNESRNDITVVYDMQNQTFEIE